MLKSKKKEFVQELEDIYKNNSSVIITHYQGLTVAEISELRKKLRQNNSSYKVIKNTLSRIASANTKLNVAPEIFKGPTAIAFSSDPVAVAKEVVDFAKENEKLKIVSGIVDGNIVDENAIQKLAKLPSIDELRGKIVGILNTPAINLARLASAPATKVVRVIKAYSETN